MYVCYLRIVQSLVPYITAFKSVHISRRREFLQPRSIRVIRPKSADTILYA